MYHYLPVSNRLPRRKAVALSRAMSPADLWIWRGAFLFGMGAWAAVALLIKALV
jgi:hypothetical protein